MNEELDSQLSAMFDDELATAECELLARRLSRDAELRARWERYAVIAAAMRAERGVRLNARIAGRVSVIVGAEPALAAAAASGRAPRRWVRPVAGAAVAASVAAVSILWLRGHTVPGAVVAAPELAAVPASRVTAPAVVRAVARTAGPDSYVVPPATRAATAIVPAELANYVVAHSTFSPPVARRNLLSSFMTSEPGAAGPIAVSTDGAQDPPRDAKGSAQ
jgi:sigma-E factor negative regulatory protein RseA